jgi:hypothetical protein
VRLRYSPRGTLSGGDRTVQIESGICWLEIVELVDAH